MPETWYKVDNVAKVFLASINRRDPRVFRVSCTLNEDVDPDCLNQALEQTRTGKPAVPGHAAPWAVLALF